MEVIKRKDLENEKKKLTNITKTQNWQEILVASGYENKILGTSIKYAIHHKEILEMNIKTRKFLNGEYLVVGLGCEFRNSDTRYKYFVGYVKEIKD